MKAFLVLLLLLFSGNALAAEYIPPDGRSTDWSMPSQANDWFGAGASQPKAKPQMRVMPTMPAVPSIIAPLPVPRPHAVRHHRHRHHHRHHVRHHHHRRGHWACHWIAT